ncbi:MAG: hypothetical protein ABH814_03555 [bacterium]
MKKWVTKHKDTIIEGVAILGCWELLKLIPSVLKNHNGEIAGFLVKIFTFSVTIKIPLVAPVVLVSVFVMLRQVYYKCRVRGRRLKITKATYGTDKSSFDITRELNEKIEDNKLRIVLSNNVAGDPHPGVVKKGKIKYEINNREVVKEYREGGLVNLP